MCGKHRVCRMNAQMRKRACVHEFSTNIQQRWQVHMWALIVKYIWDICSSVDNQADGICTNVYATGF